MAFHTSDIDNPHLDPVESFSYLKLVSADGHEFYLDRRIAYECDTFRKMVEKDGFKEGQTNEIKLHTVTGKLLEKVIEYLYFKYKFTDSKVAKKTEGFSGRQLAKLVLAYQVLNYKLVHREDNCSTQHFFCWRGKLDAQLQEELAYCGILTIRLEQEAEVWLGIDQEVRPCKSSSSLKVLVVLEPPDAGTKNTWRPCVTQSSSLLPRLGSSRQNGSSSLAMRSSLGSAF
ncbi:unnamed protein product [Polarella glacialis]|uniref:Elongin-C n=1 Tax=Polarella glacialis TaxID=89957 RepID=A0A813D7H1_POLGL|nr:unnamed protein product [Polarella glacialis]